MKNIILALFCLSLVSISQAQVSNSVAVTIVYDGSGSMSDTVADNHNNEAPKYQIANRAVNSIIKQLTAFSQDKQIPVKVSLIYFVDGRINTGVPIVTLTSNSARLFTSWTRNFTSPAGGTPLGTAIKAAHAQLINTGALHRHILVITDGESNEGSSPEQIMAKIKQSGYPVPVYFLAFDVDASVFNKVKAQGATVASASNEVQLNTQINTILGQKIMLEAE